MSEATKIIDIISEALESMDDSMNESTVAHIYGQQTPDRVFGTITSDRNGDTKAEKFKKRGELHDMIRAAGYGVVRLHGRYAESGDGGAPVLVRERTFGVIDNNGGDDNGRMLKHLKEWGTHFGQDTILHKAHGTDIAFLHATNDKSWVKKEPEGKYAVGKFTPNVTNPNGDSSIRGRPFAYLNSNVPGTEDYRPQEKTKLGKVYARV
jgi:hypothetical protein